MDDSPDRIGPDTSPKKNISDTGRSVLRALTTKDGLIGDYDYGFLFKPNLPFMKKSRRAAPFFGLHDKMPVFLALLLGFQHALSMLAGIITPPIIIAGEGGVNLGADDTQYLVSTALIVCGILSSIQITRFHIYRSPYYIGTGLISVVGTSFAIIPVSSGAFAQMYATGYCPSAADGTKLPCPRGYGALIGTACLCSLLEIGLSFTKPSVLKRVFPPLVTGPTVTLIGISLIQSGFQDWAGGSGTPGCITRPTSGPYTVCPQVGAPHALPWGSAEYIGLGFSVFVTIILAERFGSPIMKSCGVIIGLLVGCIIAAATGYFSASGVNAAPAASFIWVKTFPLNIYAPIILPLLAVYIVLMMEAIGDITATCDVSRLEVEGRLFESRIQGGVLADGFNGLIAGLCTITPMSTFAQNNGVIALTRCANRKAGYCACFFLIVMGIFSKFAAALVSIPSPVLGGLTTFLFASVAVSGLRIISTVPFTRRNRFILTASLSIGFGAILQPDWFSYVFTYSGPNQSKQGFFNAIVLVMETGFAVTAFIAIFLNLVLAEEIEDEAASITANEVDAADDREEWAHIKQGKAVADEEVGEKTETEDGKDITPKV
ncbi:hypothetical protein JMJ35_005954 [Cladonia borealis]|uniref:Purine permease n=1 Tax=Cladonia borealis TaxID=184061 RepID=A0AA39QZQ0_9LECA|nr:hypothetical protein JMJ35_005954 [Cladonia borealis]